MSGDLQDSVSESEICTQFLFVCTCLLMCLIAKVFIAKCSLSLNTTSYLNTTHRCFFLFFLLGNMCKYLQEDFATNTSDLYCMLFFPPLSFSFQSEPTYRSGFGIGGQGYRQMGVHLPACSTSHGTNVTTQRAFGCLSTTEKSHWHG